MRTINRAGVTLIKSFEGLGDGDPTTVNLDPYMDSAKYWTIGWGHLIVYNKRPLRGNADAKIAKALYPHGIDNQEAERLLLSDIDKHARALDTLLSLTVNSNQYAALVSFVFNLGPERFRTSTLRRLVNESKFADAAKEFPKWNKADGRVERGLVRRRAAEAALFTYPDLLKNGGQ